MAQPKRKSPNTTKNKGSRSSSYRGTSANRNNSTKRSVKKSSNTNPLAVVLAVVIVLLVCAGLIGGYWYSQNKYLLDDDIIIPGIVVAGIDLNGMTREEAYMALSRRLDDEIMRLKINISYDGQTWTYDHKDLEASGDVTKILDEIMLYGHQGELADRIASAEYVMEHGVDYQVGFQYDSAKIKPIVQDLKNKYDIKPLEPSLEFTGASNALYGINNRMSYNPLSLQPDLIIEGEMFSIIPGQNGLEVDLEGTVNAILTDMADDFVANVDLITNPVYPTQSEVNIMGSTDLVYHSKSHLASSSNDDRDHNVEIALAAFDGLVLYPGDVVSFNQTTGERSKENGYRLAPSIAQDKSLELVYGGGVCQAATVMLNAALMSGCTIEERQSHSWTAYDDKENYQVRARDAMVNWGTSDLVFRNTTDYSLYFNTYVHRSSSGSVDFAYCNVYSKLLPDGQVYKIESVDQSVTPPPETKITELTDLTQFEDKEWTYNETTGKMTYTHIKSKTGYVVIIYRLTVTPDGTVVNNEKMYLAEYKPIQGEIYTKPATIVPADTNTETEDPGVSE